MVELIACTGNNIYFMKTAKEHGYKYGVCLPATVYDRLYFADQNWKKPDFKIYTAAVGLYRPSMATILDLEQPRQFNEVMRWGEEVSNYVDNILIIPKVPGIIAKIPKSINGKRVILAFSIPTEYGGTYVDINEFKGWPIHLLGGNPFQQLRTASLLNEIAEVISADGNYHVKMATKSCQFFSPKRVERAANKHWPTLLEMDGKLWEGNGTREAFRRSCQSIMEYWHDFRIFI